MPLSRRHEFGRCFETHGRIITDCDTDETRAECRFVEIRQAINTSFRRVEEASSGASSRVAIPLQSFGWRRSAGVGAIGEHF